MDRSLSTPNFKKLRLNVLPNYDTRPEIGYIDRGIWGTMKRWNVNVTCVLTLPSRSVRSVSCSCHWLGTLESASAALSSSLETNISSSSRSAQDGAKDNDRKEEVGKSYIEEGEKDEEEL